MRPAVTSLLTSSACNDACWHAREHICRCSCGGKNHGCLKRKGGAAPPRQVKIDGCRYEIVAVGKYRDLTEQSRLLNHAKGWKSIDDRVPSYVYHYDWRDTDAQAPARMKPASASQVEKWPELTAYRGGPRPYILWRRVDGDDSQGWCKGACASCAREQAKIQPVKS